MDFDITIPIGSRATLPGNCRIPQQATGLIMFVHGSGSSRHSPRNRLVSDALYARGLGTLLFDLLTEPEGSRRQNVFDIDLLTDRVGNARNWITEQPELQSLPLGLFGASTGAAAAIMSAAREPTGVDAIVCRGGRVDLASRWLPKVSAPTLFIVGALDHQVRQWNEESARALRCEHRIKIVSGASHLFEEPGALEAVAELAGGWFNDHLRCGV